MFILSKKTRSIFIITILVIAAAMAIGAVITYMFPGYERVNKTEVKGEGTAEIIFSVLMDDNPVYEDNIVSDEKYYLKPFTDYLDIDCYLNVETDRDTDIECVSRIYGLLISEITTEDGKDIVWEKRYDYAGDRSENCAGTELRLSRQAYVRLDKYEELTDSLIDDYNIYTDYYLRIVFENDVTISVGGKSETEQISTYMDIPFVDNVMEITNESPTAREILIQEEINQKREPNEDLAFLFIVLLAASIICLLIVVFRTKGVDKQDKFATEVEKIFKEYGNRLAGLTDTLAYQSSVMISIDKMEDMVKIADEIGQTIFYYEVDEKDERKIEFYVFDEGRIYYLVMFGTLNQEKD